MFFKESKYLSPSLIAISDLVIISGKMQMEDPTAFFEEITLFTNNSPYESFRIELIVEYVNSSSSKHLLNYFNLVQSLKEKGKFKSVSILWHMFEEDEGIKELIHDLSNISNLNIKIIKLYKSKQTA